MAAIRLNLADRTSGPHGENSVALLLGPIVGHTTGTASRIWIQVEGDPAERTLHVAGAGESRFLPTESGEAEFGTAIADIGGLSPDNRYEYEVRHGDAAEATGRFRTLPAADAREILLLSASCDSLSVAGDQPQRGAWDLMQRLLEERRPHGLVLLGDQVYLDTEAHLWDLPLDMDRRERRQRMAAAYRRYWSRQPVADILANLPSWMMWDDHDIRNGWGSGPGDSPSLAARFPRGREIARRYQAYFEDARQVCWHFQLCRNPDPIGIGRDAFLGPGARHALPFRFDIGRCAVVVLDNRGARDEWRRQHPALGERQWQWLQAMVERLDPATDALLVIVPLPVVTMANHGVVQLFLGHRSDDLRLFARGDAAALRHFGENQPKTLGGRALEYLAALRDLIGAELFHLPTTGRFGLADLTDVRDNWANHRVRRERNALLRLALRAREVNRDGRPPRAVSFIGGDIHAGALMDLAVRDGPVIPTLVTSGIGQSPSEEPVAGTVLQSGFRVMTGVRAHLRGHCVAHNCGATRIDFGESGAAFHHAVVTPSQVIGDALGQGTASRGV